MHAIGVSLRGENIKSALFKKENGKVSLCTLSTSATLPAVETASSVEKYLFLKKLIGDREQPPLIATGLDADKVFIRSLILPLSDKRKLLSTLPFQMEELLPFPQEEAIVCPFLKAHDKQSTEVTAVATTQSRLGHHLERLNEKGIFPNHVSCAPWALLRFVKWLFPLTPTLLILHREESQILATFIEGGKVALSQTLLLKCEADLSYELERFSLFLAQKHPLETPLPWMLTGITKGNESLFSATFQGEQLVPEDQKLDLSYALEIGYALDALANDPLSLQFCQKEFTPALNKIKRRRAIASYLAVCGALTLLTAGVGTLMLHKKERILCSYFNQVAPAAFKKNEVLTIAGVENALLSWEKTLKPQKSTFPLISNAPKVSDALAWISTHPSFSTQEGDLKEGIEIKSLHYQLTSYPQIGAHSPYLAQITLDFTTPTPQLAREFHETLLKGDPFISSKHEIKWQPQGSSYRAVFTLNKIDS